MNDITNHLASRRSIPIPALLEPGPDDRQITEMLTIAARVPDHGKLAPWRFILYRGEASERILRALGALAASREDFARTHQPLERKRFLRAPLVVGVVSTAGPHEKIPEWEQVLSGGAAAMNLVHAAHSLGFAANWVTEWVAYDEEAKAVLGISPDEKVIGFIHIGTPSEPPSERPRPDLASIVSEAPVPPETA